MYSKKNYFRIAQKMILKCLLVVAAFALQVHCHGNMVWPHNWQDKKMDIPTDKGIIHDYVGMKSGLMCMPGSDISNKEVCDPDAKDKSCDHFKKPGEVCFWYNNGTWIKKPTLFNPELRTYLYSNDQKRILHYPWRAPGSAPLDSPCGVAGGNLHGCKGGCFVKAGGYANGPKAENFKFDHKFFVTNWTRGEEVEVAWAILANHGGGYSYRLCKIPEEGISGLTEECFQRTPLQFVGERQWVQYGEDASTRYQFSAVRVSTGTFPEGSQWTKNPIPACRGRLGGLDLPTAECVHGTQFDPPGKGLSGYGVNFARSIPKFQFSIIDKVLIPKNLESGEYVLSFRWDCEQTPQVWNSCASIHLD